MDFDGLPDGDEMHSSDDVNEAKKRKGRGPTMLDYNALSKAKQIGVQFNDKGQHFGAGSASLSSSAGILARQLIPVTYASWDEVPTILKDKLWAAMKQKYDLAPCRKKILLTQMSGCWRTYKATLTKQIRSLDDGPDAMEQMQLLKPANVEKQADGDKFVKHRCSPEFDAISEKFKKLKSFHTLLHVMSRKGYARLEDELDDIKLANEMPTTDNASIKDDALSQTLGPEHRGRLRGGGYGVTPSRYDAQTYASMSNRELRDRLQNVEGKLREVFDLVLAKQQNEGNGKETNTNDAIQVSINRPQGGCIDLQRTKNGVKQVPNSSYQVSRSSPQLQCNKKSAPEANDGSRHTSKASSQIQCDRRSAQEADDASRQASKASSQRSSPNIERDNIKRKEGSKATSQLQPVGILRGSSCKLLNWLGNGQVVATGEIESTNPEAKVHHMVLGPDCWKVWVTVVKVENISLYRPTSEFRVLEDDVSSTIAWPSKYVRVGE
ncbi:hypothetical protein DVH24_021812 [Malus domestica]|uniref:DUF8039 domain-containing protein n=1 Tax=Malus domestica TaxID=3750 RepID=A0A498ITF4_MALDO|nr:hypothetical protein DVH24_021812 [Malus domestica]